MRLTPVVRDLLIINTGMLVLSWILAPMGINLIDILGLHYPSSPHFRWYQVFTHMFMHANFVHLLFNMYALWLFGTILERLWGSKRFLFYYLLTGFGAALLHTAVSWWEIHRFVAAAQAFLAQPDLEHFMHFYSRYPEYFNPRAISVLLERWEAVPSSTAFASQVIPVIQQALEMKINIPIVGASGAVFGLLLAFGMLFPEVPLFIMFIPIPVKAKYFVIGYGLLELINGISNIPGDNIAHFAHLGGMIFGYILIKYWDRKGKPRYGGWNGINM